MTNTKLFLLIGTSLSLIPHLTFAQCVATQDCATLGYTETSCAGGSGVKCPFGNKWACFKSESEFCNEYGFTQTCTGANQTSGSGKACNGKYYICKCATNFTWNTDTKSCEANTSNCVIGALYYSDGTCSDKLESSKTLLGVVISEKSDAENGWIMAINPVKTDIIWSTEYVDISGILTTSSESGLTDIHASCSNTNAITAQGNSSKYPAAWAAKNYKPTGTPNGKSWCLPSGGLLRTALDNSISFTKVNAGITTAGGTILGNVSGGLERVWSSSEYDLNSAWHFLASTKNSFYMAYNFKGGTGSLTSTSFYSVRPVMAF